MHEWTFVAPKVKQFEATLDIFCGTNDGEGVVNIVVLIWRRRWRQWHRVTLFGVADSLLKHVIIMRLFFGGQCRLTLPLLLAGCLPWQNH